MAKRTTSTGRTKTGSRKRGSPPRRRGARRLRLLAALFALGAVALSGWALVLDRQITARFEGRRWQVPSRVYARPLELFEGAPVDADGLRYELGLLRYQKAAGAPEPGTYSESRGRFTLDVRAFDYGDEKAPARRISFSVRDGRLADLAGAGSGPVRLDPVEIGVIFPADKEDRILVRLQDVPELLTKALVAVEDRDFRTHHGVVPSAILRALWVNWRAGRVVQGGSTLTQQLVKNFFLDSERTMWRKATEAMMALILEARYTKDEILETYLNEVYLGQDGKRAVHGFGLGARFYFGRSLRALSPDKLALLVGLVKGPNYYDPRRHPDRALARRNLVLSELERQGLLSAKEAAAARGRPLGIIEKPSLSEALFPAYLDLVKRHLSRDYADEDLRSEGLRIFTALDPQLQRRAEQALDRTLSRIEGRRGKGLEGAVVLTGTESGEVVALVGGRDPRLAGFNRALDAVRPIGSLVKPAICLTALASPDRYTLLTPLKDEPLELKLQNGDTWAPKNYDGRFEGEVPLHEALAFSRNVPMARLGLDLGVDAVADTLVRLGVQRTVDRVPAMLLGAVSLAPVEVAKMYQTIASTGFDTPLRTVREVVTADGRILSRYPYETRQVIPPETVHLVQYAMQEVAQEGTARSMYSVLPTDLGVAGKTGTTNEGRDSWFAGFTGDWLGVVWVGRDDDGPAGLTGASGALRVWVSMMNGLAQRGFEPTVPEGVTYQWIDGREGAITDEACKGARYVPFVNGSEPRERVTCLTGLERLGAWFRRLLGHSE